MRQAALLAITLLLIAAGSAWGQQNYWTFSAGYSNVQFDRQNNGTFYNHNGAYFDTEFLYRLPDLRVPLMLGGGFGASGYFDNKDVTFPTDFGAATTTLYSDVGLFSLEARAALPIAFDHGAPGFFVTPQLGMGLLVSNYSIDTVQTNSSFTSFHTRCFTGAAFDIRPTIQTGYSWGPASAGLEASYMIAWGNFGDLGSQAQEFRIGVFIQFGF